MSGCGARISGKPEAARELFTLDVAEGDGESVGGVGRLGRFLHLQKRAYHQLHLFFVGMAVAGNTGFYFTGRIRADFNTMLFRGKQHDAANFGQAQGGTHVQRGENGLHCHGVGMKLFD